jgi:hypothetical protein
MFAFHDYSVVVGPDGKMGRFSQFALMALVPEVLDFRRAKAAEKIQHVENRQSHDDPTRDRKETTLFLQEVPG